MLRRVLAVLGPRDHHGFERFFQQLRVVDVGGLDDYSEGTTLGLDEEALFRPGFPSIRWVWPLFSPSNRDLLRQQSADCHSH